MSGAFTQGPLLEDRRVQIARLNDAAAVTARSRVARFASRPIAFLQTEAVARWCRATGRSAISSAEAFWGGRLRLSFPDRVALAIARYGYFEADLSIALLWMLRPGTIFFDVGAHQGYFSALALHLVGPEGEVHAFEPSPSTFAVLSSNFREASNVTLNNVAVYSHDGELELTVFGPEFSAFDTLFEGRMEASERRRATGGRIAVRALSIDSYVERTGVSPDFVKIDAEDAELHVLEGMRETLRLAAPLLAIEVGDVGARRFEHRSRRVVEYVLHSGYSAFEIGHDGLAPHALQEKYEHKNLLFVPGASG